MKIKKGKKSGIEHRLRKSHPRYKTTWEKEGDGKPDKCLIVKQPLVLSEEDTTTIEEAISNISTKPEAPPSKLKESAKAMRVAMPNTFGDLVEPDKPSKKLSRVEKKARKKADVIPIGSKSLGKTGRTRDAEAEQIAKLEQHIKDHTTTIDAGIVGPPKPTELQTVTEVKAAAPPAKKASVHSITGGTASNDVVQYDESEGQPWYQSYGKVIRDTGRGMTPSGLPISEFLEGGKYPPVSKKLQSVTDYSHEELATKYDGLQLELQRVKADYERRLEVRDERITSMEKVLFSLRQAERVESFSDAHTKDAGAAIVELRDENDSLTRDNTQLRKEIDNLTDDVEKLERHNNVSNNSKAPLKTLTNQFELYMVQHRDDPIRNFLRRSGYSLGQCGELRKHFDTEANVRLEANAKRQADRAEYYASGMREKARLKAKTKAESVGNEVFALERIGTRGVVTDCNSAYQLRKEMQVYKSWGHRTTTPMCAKKLNYHQWWVDNLTPEDAKLRALRTTTTAKVIKPVLTAARKVNELLNYELSPTIRKAEVDKRKAKKLARIKSMRKEKNKASRIKHDQDQKFEKDLQEERAKEAYRIAH